MTLNSSRFAPGVLITLLVASCGDNGDLAGRTPNESHLDVAMAEMPEDPCAMVLAASAAAVSDAADGIGNASVRRQTAPVRSPQPLPRLERLGWAFVAKARANRDAGFYTLAGQTAACIERKVPGAAESLLLKGHVLHNQHRFREAEQVARRLVAQRGLWFDFALLGDVSIELGALDQAIDAYQRVLDQRPGPQAYMRAAQLRWLKGDLDGAIEMMVAAVRATSRRTPEAAAWARVRLAQWLMQADDSKGADAVLESALSLQPDYPPALHGRGRLRLAQDRPQEALPLLERAVRSDPLPEFRWSLYEALLEAGRPDAAGEQKTTLLERGAAEDPRTLALFLAGTGEDPSTALALALQELERRGDVFTLDAVAWALSGAGRQHEALDFSRRALAEGTRDARLFLHAGVIAARAGDRQRALALLDDAGTIKHLLLPSELQQLATEFAALQPQITARNGHRPRRDILSSERRNP